MVELREKPLFLEDLTDVLAASMLRAAPGTELAMFNGGSIRIDDEIPPGEVTEYDVLRTLPFGDAVLSVDMTGSVLQRALDQGRANAGTGGFLQTANVTRSAAGDRWLIGGAPINSARRYKLASHSSEVTVPLTVMSSLSALAGSATGAGGSDSGFGSAFTQGNRTVNVVPLPSWLSTLTFPA